jgi:hypothetical protein
VPLRGSNPLGNRGFPRLPRKATDLFSASPASKERNREAPSCHPCGGHRHRFEHGRTPVGTGFRNSREGAAVGWWQSRATAWRRQQGAHPELFERAPMARGSVPEVRQRQALSRECRSPRAPAAERVADGAVDQRPLLWLLSEVARCPRGSDRPSPYCGAGPVWRPGARPQRV